MNQSFICSYITNVRTGDSAEPSSGDFLSTWPKKNQAPETHTKVTEKQHDYEQTFLMDKKTGNNGLILNGIHGMRAEDESTTNRQLTCARVQHTTHPTSRHHTQTNMA